MAFDKEYGKLNVTFIGGCINAPVGIRGTDIYYRLLTPALPGIVVALNKYYSYSALLKKSEEVIRKDSPDILFVFLRLFPYMVLNKPFVKLVDEHNKHYYRFHPALMKRDVAEWPEHWDVFVEKYGQTPFPKRRYFGMRDLNMMAGGVLGLQKWAVRYVCRIIGKIKETCGADKQLIIIGPPFNPETYMGSRISSFLNSKAKRAAAKLNVRYIDIHDQTDEHGNSLFQDDKIHFNSYGHSYLAARILPALEEHRANRLKTGLKNAFV